MFRSKLQQKSLAAFVLALLVFSWAPLAAAAETRGGVLAGLMYDLALFLGLTDERAPNPLPDSFTDEGGANPSPGGSTREAGPNPQPGGFGAPVNEAGPNPSPGG